LQLFSACCACASLCYTHPPTNSSSDASLPISQHCPFDSDVGLIDVVAGGGVEGQARALVGALRGKCLCCVLSPKSISMLVFG
jgi:hypothetical protein